MALINSHKDQMISYNTCVSPEIGLTGPVVKSSGVERPNKMKVRQ